MTNVNFDFKFLSDYNFRSDILVWEFSAAAANFVQCVLEIAENCFIVENSKHLSI